MRRRTLLAAPLLAAPAVGRGAASRALRFVPAEGGVAILDPVWAIAWPTLPFGLQMYESLYAPDSTLAPRPQMAEGHVIDDDGRRWAIRLRDGLRFHDGEPVLARDCVASIRRWMARDSIGRSTLAERLDALEAQDDRTVVFRLKRPFPQLAAVLGKPQPNILPIMPARLAAADPGSQQTEIGGSGPFRFVPGEFAAGALAVQARFDAYVPRNEPPDGMAGGRIARLDRIEWVAMPDAATAASALLTGEADWLEAPAADLLPLLRRGRDIAVRPFNPFGQMPLLRPNHAAGPTANAGVRAAIMAAIDPREVMQAGMGADPDSYASPVGVFRPGSAAASDAGLERLGPKPPAEVRAMLRAAGYANEPVVLLHPADSPAIDPMFQLVAERLRQAGLNVDDQVMDTATVATRSMRRDPPGAGGWSLTMFNVPGAGHSSPLVAQGLRTGAAAAPGWPTDPAMEALRDRWLDSTDPAEQRALCARIQDLALREGILVPLGHHVRKSAWRGSVTGILEAPEPLMWNVAKA